MSSGSAVMNGNEWGGGGGFAPVLCCARSLAGFRFRLISSASGYRLPMRGVRQGAPTLQRKMANGCVFTLLPVSLRRRRD